MRKLYLLLFSAFTLSFASAQVSVTATLGASGPTNYATLKAAFDAINNGTHKGVVTLAITTGTTETVPAVLNASGTGSSSYTAVLVQPAGGVPCTISGDVAGTLIDLDGADNVTINGLNVGGNSLTLTNVNTSATASTIRFINDASGNTVTNTTILGASSGIASATIFFSSGTATGNDNNTISNCNVGDNAAGLPANAILSTGSVTAGQENSNNTISTSNIYNFFNAGLATNGILLNTGNTDWTINTNRFYQTTARTFTTANTHRVIQVISGNNYLISGNIIGYAASNASGVYTLGGSVASKFVAIELNVGSAAPSNVYNNTISAINFSTTSSASATTFFGVWCGIYVIAGDVNVGTIASNTIGNTSGTGSIVVSPTVNGAFVVAVSSTSTGTVFIANNNIGAMELVPTGVNAGTLAGILTAGASGTITLMNNTIGNATANNMKIGVAGTTTQSGIIRGIINSNAGTVNITWNTIRNMIHNGTASTTLLRGIEYQAGTGSIYANTLNNISAGGTIANFSTQAGVGILVSSTQTGIVIDSNTIYNLNLTNVAGTTGAILSGIYAGVPSTTTGIVNGLTISRNKIYNFSNANVATSTTAPAAMIGIFCGNANAANPLTIVNNMIALGSGQSTNTAVIGIMSYHAASQNYTARIYHNSIDIEGVVGSGAQPSFAYYRGDFSATALTVPTLDIRNNIFVNNRNGGTGKHYTIANGYGVTSNATGWSSDYNILNGTETTLTYWNTDQGLSTWQTASAGDAHSTSSAVNFVNAPSDLHLNVTNNAGASNNGTPLPAVTVDIDYQSRSATTPDIGADEFNILLSIKMEYFNGAKQGNENLLTWKANCTAAFVRFELGRSQDGKLFEYIHTIDATKDQCAASFAFNDTKPMAGINYYRLKITEADGAVSYSSVIAIINNNNGVRIIQLVPSVFSGNSTTVQIASAKKETGALTITDMQGKAVFNRSIQLLAGSNNVKLQLPHLSSGIYVMHLLGKDGSSSSYRFIKQ